MLKKITVIATVAASLAVMSSSASFAAGNAATNAATNAAATEKATVQTTAPAVTEPSATTTPNSLTIQPEVTNDTWKYFGFSGTDYYYDASVSFYNGRSGDLDLYIDDQHGNINYYLYDVNLGQVVRGPISVNGYFQGHKTFFSVPVGTYKLRAFNMGTVGVSSIDGAGNIGYNY